MAFCSNCGNEIKNEETFCNSCGKKLDNCNERGSTYSDIAVPSTKDPMQKNLSGSTIGAIVGGIIAFIPLLIILTKDKINNGTVIFLLIGFLVGIIPSLVKKIADEKKNNDDKTENSVSIKTVIFLIISILLFLWIGLAKNSILSVIIAALIPIVSMILYAKVFNIKTKWLKIASLAMTCICVIPFSIKVTVSHVRESNEIKQAEKKAEQAEKKAEETAKVQEKLEEANLKARSVSIIFSNYKDNYMPDGIEKRAACTNIDSTYYIEGLSDEIDKKVGGSWLIIYYVSSTKDISQRESYTCYWAENETNKYVGCSSYSKEPTDTTEGGLRSIFESTCVKFITSDEWNKKYESEWQEKYDSHIENKLNELRDKRFTYNRSLNDICHNTDSDVIGEFESYNNSDYSVSGLSVKIEDGNAIITGTINNKIDYRRYLTIMIEFYNSAGEEKDGAYLEISDAVAGQASHDFEFEIQPNCIDELAYYRIIAIIDKK